MSKKKIVQFKELSTDAPFIKCYDFDSIPTTSLRFRKISPMSALQEGGTLAWEWPTYFRPEQPVFPL